MMDDFNDNSQPRQTLGDALRELAGAAANDSALDEVKNHRAVDAMADFFAQATEGAMMGTEAAFNVLLDVNKYLESRGVNEDDKNEMIIHVLEHKASPLLTFKMNPTSAVYLYGAPRLEQVMSIPSYLELHLTARELGIGVELQGYDDPDSKGDYGVRFNLLKSYEQGREENPGTYPSEDIMNEIEARMAEGNKQQQAAQAEFQDRVLKKGEDPHTVMDDLQQRMKDGVMGTENDTRPAPQPEQKALPPGPPPEAPQAKSPPKGKFKL